MDVKTAERVPIADGDAKMVLHRSPRDFAIRVVVAVRQGRSRVETLEPDLLDTLEIRFRHRFILLLSAG